jgi:hypothetical protein
VKVKQTSEYQEIAEEVEKLMREMKSTQNKTLEQIVTEITVSTDHSKKRKVSEVQTNDNILVSSSNPLKKTKTLSQQ